MLYLFRKVLAYWIPIHVKMGDPAYGGHAIGKRTLNLIIHWLRRSPIGIVNGRTLVRYWNTSVAQWRLAWRPQRGRIRRVFLNHQKSLIAVSKAQLVVACLKMETPNLDLVFYFILWLNSKIIPKEIYLSNTYHFVVFRRAILFCTCKMIFLRWCFLANSHIKLEVCKAKQPA